MDRSEFISRSRKAARLMITVSDTVNALSAEADLTGAFLAPEDGGLKASDFVGPNADISSADIFAFYAVLGAIFGQLTAEQKRAFYRVRDNTGPVSILLGGPEVV